MLEADQPTREVQSAISIMPSVYPWSASTERNTRASPSISYSTSYTGQAPYIALDSATDDPENTEASQGVGNTPVVGLRLPQQVFTPQQGAGDSSEKLRAGAEDEKRGSFPHLPQYPFPY